MKKPSLFQRLEALSDVLIFACLASAVAPSYALSDPLRRSDISILWPLKASMDIDDAFKSKGDGFCNALGLGEGTMLPAPAFDAFAKTVLNGSGGVCSPDTALQNRFLFDATDTLMKPDIHLARLKGIAPNVCSSAAWKVVALRFDPCQNLPDATAKKAVCLPLFRLVAQPFEKATNGLWVARDFTMHLIYSVPDVNALVADLKSVAQVAKGVEATETWEAGIDGTDVLRPHHALRNEMDACGGPASTSIRQAVLRHAIAPRLLKIAWMSSSLGVKEWTFGILNVKGTPAGPGLPSTFALSETTALGTRFDNFSDTLMMQGKPPLNSNLAKASFLNASGPIALAALPDLPAAQASDAARLANIDTLQAILDPTKKTQGDTNCTSCHLAPQTLTRLRAMYKAPGAVGSGSYEATVWPGFEKEPRSFVQLRNFGYGPRFNMSINRRTINETDAAAKALARTHP